jgi:thioredoxin 1
MTNSELDEIKKRKIEHFKKYYLKGEKNMQNKSQDAPFDINDADFDETVKKYKIIAIDCWAPWCGPCRMMTPVIDELAKEMKDKIVFCKINVDENPITSIKYKILTIPTLLIFKNGNLVDRLIGAFPKDELKNKLSLYK